MFISGLVYGQIPTSGLRGEYTFPGGSLNGTTQLTQVGSAVTVETDRLSEQNAINLNGDVLRTSGMPDTDITVSFWVKTTTNDGAKRVIIDQSSRTTAAETSSKIGWYVFLKNGTVNLAANYLYNHWSNTAAGTTGYSGYNDILTTVNVADGNWHHVTFTARGYRYDYFNGPYQRWEYFVNYDYKIYVDGYLSKSQTVSTPIGSRVGLRWDLTPSGYITFGNSRGINSPERYTESLDDIRLYERLLSSTEIVALSREGVCAPPLEISAESTGSTSGTVTWYNDPISDAWDLAYTPTGQPVANATIVPDLNTNTHTITGLSANTTYDVYIRSKCNGTPTDWSSPISFTTLEGIIYVDQNASGANNGSSWADAYTNLQDALPQGTATKHIWVAAGTYKPHASDRRGTFNIPTNVKLYGGFAGNETDLSERDIQANTTTLSGDLQGNDNAVITDIEATRQDNSYHVVTIRGNAQNVVLDGFTITGGNANGSNNNSCSVAAASQYFDTRGGAIYVNPYAYGHVLSAKVRNCILEKNTGASVGVYSYFTPCGVENLSHDVDFESCIIRDNYSKDHSAMMFAGSNGYDVRGGGSVVNSVFYNNTSTNSAACMYLGTSNSNGGNVNALTLEIVNTTMTDNTGANGNVINMVRASNTKIKNSIIYGNGSATPFAITSSGSVVTNSIVEGGQQNGTNADPLFNDAANHDYSLTCASPAVGTADDAVQLPANDLAGNKRKNGDLDMGAYEYYHVPTPIDVLTQDITVSLDATGNYTLSPEEVDNNTAGDCGSEFTLSLDKTTFDCTQIGAHTVTLTATASNGGAQYSATATVTVEDALAPTPVAAQSLVVTLDANGNGTLDAATVNNGSTDNCTAEANLVLSIDKTAFTCDDLGSQTVNLSVEDAYGNSATIATQVSVVDNILPVAAAKNITVELGSTGSVTIDPATLNNGSTDNCAAGLSYSLTANTFSCEDLGANTMTFTATDANGNEATTEVVVTVVDNVAPVARAKNITVYLDANGTAAITPADINNNSFDNCTASANLIMTIDRSQFSCEDIAVNNQMVSSKSGKVAVKPSPVQGVEVTLSVEDAHGNTSSATAIVSVVDNAAPTVSAKNITVELDASGNATITPQDINNNTTDNCSPFEDLNFSLSKTNFSCSDIAGNTGGGIKPNAKAIIEEPVNNNQVTLTVRDKSGNTATATAIVTVVDRINPTVVTQNITVRLDANNSATIEPSDVDNGSSDNCTGLSFSLDKTAFDETNIGQNTVVLTVTDNSGNSTTGTAVVTVEENKDEQTITFGELADKVYGDADFTLSATASSNLAVVFSIVEGPATIQGNTLSITGAGSVTVRASQEGNDDFYAATPVDQTFTVAKADQTITFAAIDTKLTTEEDFDISATASSGLDLTYTISGPATLSGTTVSLDGTPGTVTITATQAGDDNHNAATQSITFEVAVPAAIGDELEEIVIYPNPASKQLKIDVPKQENVEAGLYNLDGILMISKRMAANNRQMDISHLKAGVYILKLQSEKRSTTTRILIER